MRPRGHDPGLRRTCIPATECKTQGAVGLGAVIPAASRLSHARLSATSGPCVASIHLLRIVRNIGWRLSCWRSTPDAGACSA